MMFSPYTAILSLSALLSAVSAHVYMYDPTPFPGSALSPWPLNATDFPCNVPSDFSYNFSNATNVTAGSTVPVHFWGSAIHGGGSCQFSLSTKPGSTDPQDWKVIQTFIGGCPGTVNGDGNLLQLTGYGASSSSQYLTNLTPLPDGLHCSSPGANETDCVRSYEIKIPDQVPPGQYSFAWTWFNNVGNREMYMGCAPLTITSNTTGSNSAVANSTYLDSLPSLFVANIDGYCTTNQDPGVLAIPNPGDNVDVSNNVRDTIGASVIGTCPTTTNTPADGGPGGTVITPVMAITYTNVPPTPASILAAMSLANPSATTSVVQHMSSSAAIPNMTTSPVIISVIPSTAAATASSYRKSSSTFTIWVTVYSTSSATSSADFEAPTAASVAATNTQPFYTTSSHVSPIAPSAPASSIITMVTSAMISSTASSSCPGTQLPCPAEIKQGQLFCPSLFQYAICDRGCGEPMDVAFGTVCQNAVIVKA